MLRREFIKTTSITLGGLIVFSNLPSFGANNYIEGRRKIRSRVYHLHGDAKSGCASPPELTDLLANGISYVPPGWYG